MAVTKGQGSRRLGRGTRARGKEQREGSAAAAMLAREKGRETETETEEKEKEEGEKFGKQFFRVFMPEQCAERLRIPSPFCQHLQNLPTGVVSLKSQSGNTWLAELASDTQGLFFGCGWKQFAVDHALEFGHFLTFRYDGHSKFSVVVFDATCVEKQSAFNAKPCKNVVIKKENHDGDMDINATDPSEMPATPLEETNATTRKRIRQMDLSSSTVKKPSIVLGNGKRKGHGVSVGLCKAASTSFDMDTNAVDSSEPPAKRNKSRMKMKMVGEIGVNGSTLVKSSSVLKKDNKVCEASVGTCKVAATRTLKMDMNKAGPSEVKVASIDKSCVASKKRVREMDTNGSTSKKLSYVSEKGKQQQPEASFGAHKLGSASRNRKEDLDFSSSVKEESILCNKSTKSMPLLQRLDNNVAKHGINIMRSQRQPTVISQRPPITEEQKKNALEKAKQFKSKNPFVLQIMKESYVYVGFFMKLPSEFIREYLPRTSKNIKLWDPQGKAWEVNYIYYKEQSSGAFSGGWSRFSMGNCLEKFDVCVFELCSRDNIKVHIYRVVPEITPFLLGSNSK